MYADDNRDQFPDCSTGPSYMPWDLPVNAANDIIRNGGKRDILYYDPPYPEKTIEAFWTIGSSAKGELGKRTAG
jgi:hypothetical protein